MPITYTIYAKDRLVITTITGSVSIDEFQKQMGIIKSDPLYDPSYQKLMDFRQGSIDSPCAERQKLSKVKAQEYADKNERLALLASTPEETAYCLMFESLFSKNNVKVFSTLEAALTWLGKSTMIDPDQL